MSVERVRQAVASSAPDIARNTDGFSTSQLRELAESLSLVSLPDDLERYLRWVGNVEDWIELPNGLRLNGYAQTALEWAAYPVEVQFPRNVISIVHSGRTSWWAEILPQATSCRVWWQSTEDFEALLLPVSLDGFLGIIADQLEGRIDEQQLFERLEPDSSSAHTPVPFPRYTDGEVQEWPDGWIC